MSEGISAGSHHLSVSVLEWDEVVDVVAHCLVGEGVAVVIECGLKAKSVIDDWFRLVLNIF